MLPSAGAASSSTEGRPAEGAPRHMRQTLITEYFAPANNVEQGRAVPGGGGLQAAGQLKKKKKHKKQGRDPNQLRITDFFYPKSTSSQ